MVQLAVNLSTIFTEVPFLDRFQKARECGFSFVECQFPYSFSIESIEKELLKNDLTLVLINLPAGNWEAGDRGIAVDPNRITEFQTSVEVGIQYATSLKVNKIHCMAGIVPPYIDKNEALKIYIQNIKYAAETLAKYEITLMIEPINNYDMPGYFLSSIKEAEQIISELSLPNIKIQYDFYHIERMGQNLITTFEKYSELIEHIQIADVPGRHQPGTGKINYHHVFQFLKKQGYSGYVGLEYTPLGKSEDSFEWKSMLAKGGEQI